MTQGDPSLENFFTLETLRARAKGASVAEFAKTCPGPALLVTEEAVSGNNDMETKGGNRFSLETIGGAPSAASDAARRYHHHVTFVAKRPGNPFPNMVSVGRSNTSDVVFALETVSKLHGYFLRDGERWFYTDYQSTNGTVINGTRIDKDEKRLLHDGDRVKLGLEVMAIFLLPPSLHARLVGGTA